MLMLPLKQESGWVNVALRQINIFISKTREIVIDFRKKKKRMASQPLRILGKDVEVVEDYKYRVVAINHRLD